MSGTYQVAAFNASGDLLNLAPDAPTMTGLTANQAGQALHRFTSGHRFDPARGHVVRDRVAYLLVIAPDGRTTAHGRPAGSLVMYTGYSEGERKVTAMWEAARAGKSRPAARVNETTDELTTGPLITGALDRHGIRHEVRMPYLQVATESGEILITARNCNDLGTGDYDGPRTYDIPRRLSLGFVATYYQATEPNEDDFGTSFTVYDSDEDPWHGPCAAADACAAAIALFLRPRVRMAPVLVGDDELSPQVCGSCGQGNYAPVPGEFQLGHPVYACNTGCGYTVSVDVFSLLEDGETLRIHDGLLHVARRSDAPF